MEKLGKCHTSNIFILFYGETNADPSVLNKTYIGFYCFAFKWMYCLLNFPISFATCNLVHFSRTIGIYKKLGFDWSSVTPLLDLWSFFYFFSNIEMVFFFRFDLGFSLSGRSWQKFSTAPVIFQFYHLLTISLSTPVISLFFFFSSNLPHCIEDPLAVVIYE